MTADPFETFPRLLTPAQVAEAFAVDAKTVTRWANAGKLRAVRTPGGHRRFREAEIRALLQPDTTSSASRQHFIDTGRYLPADPDPEGFDCPDPDGLTGSCASHDHDGEVR